jgi:hypothetical protein
MRWISHGGRYAVACFALLVLATPSFGQQSRSARPADELGRLLTAQQRTMVAASVPDEPDRFVAASLIPGFGLLVISARTPAGAFLADCVKRKAFEDAYSYLNGTALADGKFFVQDTGGDGLRVRQPGETAAFDVTYENVTRKVLFDGNAEGQHMTIAQYQAAVDGADARYAKLLTLLIGQLNDKAQAAPDRH